MSNEKIIIDELKLQPGDSIVIPKSGLNIVQHYALYLGFDEHYNYYMSENVVGIGVKLTRVQDFFKQETRISQIEKFEGSKEQRTQIVQTALAKLGLPYSLINYNCEHFVSDVKTGKAKSRQLEKAAIFIGIILLIAFFARKNN